MAEEDFVNSPDYQECIAKFRSVVSVELQRLENELHNLERKIDTLRKAHNRRICAVIDEARMTLSDLRKQLNDKIPEYVSLRMAYNNICKDSTWVRQWRPDKSREIGGYDWFGTVGLPTLIETPHWTIILEIKQDTLKKTMDTVKEEMDTEKEEKGLEDEETDIEDEETDIEDGEDPYDDVFDEIMGEIDDFTYIGMTAKDLLSNEIKREFLLLTEIIQNSNRKV